MQYYLKKMSIPNKLTSIKLQNEVIKGQKMAKIIKKAETMFSRFERSLESLADKIL